jgi:peroxiredoxin
MYKQVHMSKRSIYIIPFLFIGVFSIGLAQSKVYEIGVTVNNFKGEVLYLGYPYGDKKYLADTAQRDNNGSFVFDGTSELDGGLYFIYSPPPENLYFDIIVAEPKFNLQTDTTDIIRHMKPSGSVENTVFFDFQRFMRDKQKTGAELSEQLKATNDEAGQEKIREQLKSLDVEVKSYREALLKKYPQTFAAKFINSTIQIDIPDGAKDEKGNDLDPNYAYHYYKRHFFDNVDFSDKKMLRTPNFHGKVEEYMEKLTIKHPDSINASLDVIISRSRANKEVFRYCVQNLTHKYETSNIMGMDAVFVDMAEKYYLSGDAFWADEETISKIKDRVGRLKPNLLGSPAPRLLLMDTLMRPVNALNIKADYMVLYFYDPDCGHCKKKTPQLRDLYHSKLKDLGVVVVAADIKKETDKWKKYIKVQKLNWVNLADPNMQSNFRYEYNIETTPLLYILDDKKNIIAKKLDVDQVEEFIKKQIEINGRNQNPG